MANRTSRQLNSEDEQVFLERLAELSRSGKPLPDGLRAAASDATSTRLARQFRRLADKLDAGVPWEQVFRSEGAGVRPHVLGILRAGVQAGNLGEAVDSLIDQERAFQDTRREVFATLAYPALLLVLALGLVIATLLFIVPYFDAIFSDFGTELPANTIAWIRASRRMPELLLASLTGTVALPLGIRLFGGPAIWKRFLASIPVVGTLLHDAAVCQWLRLLEIMTQQRLPLSEALRLASCGVANAYVQETSEWLAQGTDSGRSISQMLLSNARLPAVIEPILHWGEVHDSLPDACRDAYLLLERRILARTSTLNVVVGPLMLIVLGVLLGSLIFAMLMPLVQLLQNLV